MSFLKGRCEINHEQNNLRSKTEAYFNARILIFLKHHYGNFKFFITFLKFKTHCVFGQKIPYKRNAVKYLYHNAKKPLKNCLLENLISENSCPKIFLKSQPNKKPKETKECHLNVPGHAVLFD